MKTSLIVYWARRDLRLTDNPALYHSINTAKERNISFAPIFILEKENKIKFKKDDDFFKQDIFYYEDTTNHVTVYYSAIEKFLIGYKEASKDYTKIVNTDAYIKINYLFQIDHFSYHRFALNNLYWK